MGGRPCNPVWKREREREGVVGLAVIIHTHVHKQNML